MTDMARIGKVLSSVAEFIGRFWPMGKDEEAVLRELDPRDQRQPPPEEPPADNPS